MNSNKVIIMEVKDDYAIVMTSDFEFIKIKKKKSMTEGQKIYICLLYTSPSPRD